MRFSSLCTTFTLSVLVLVGVSFAADLTVKNNCGVPLWIDARAGGLGGMLPGQTKSVTKISAGQSVAYDIPANGLSATRFWAKYNCDENGRNCEIGDQMQYLPGGGCPTGGCTPPVDSLFEATWGCKPGSACHASNPTTWFDTSQVDGYTIPYKVHINGENNKCDCSNKGCGLKEIDASKLSLGLCPAAENIPGIGSIDLRILDKSKKNILGCYSPCKKLSFDMKKDEGSSPTIYYCCPTPNPSNCQLSKGCISSPACRAGPVEDTQYVKEIHKTAPGIYTYAYDDFVGLHACPAGTVTYTMEFCPAGSAAFPYPVNGVVPGPQNPTTPQTSAAKTSAAKTSAAKTSATTKTTAATTAKTSAAKTSATTKTTAAPTTTGAGPTCTAKCATGLSCCGASCYSPSKYTCPKDSVNGKYQLCPLGNGSCNGACYNTAKAKCTNGKVVNK